MENRPKARRPLRADFPGIFKMFINEEIRRTVTGELAKQGIDLAAPGAERPRVFVAYPHKHQEINKDHFNPAESHLDFFMFKFREAVPEVEWVPAHAVYEARHLARSENQGIVYSLTVNHEFGVDPSLQKDMPAPFADPARRDLFVIVDLSVEQGTTVANMISFIEDKGGFVLGAGGVYTAMFMPDIAQTPKNRKYAKDAPPGGDPAFDFGRIPELAEVFAKSANEGREGAPAIDGISCVKAFDAALKRHGKSVWSLTDRECGRLVQTITGSDTAKIPQIGFNDLLRQIEEATGEPPNHPPNAKPRGPLYWH